MKYFIYKITLNDKPDYFYIGHTKNFQKRKYTHKSQCNKNDKILLYYLIRENGGWENTKMDIIEEFECETLHDAMFRERYWYDQLNPKLNTYVPKLSEEEIQKDNCDRCKKYREQHKDEIKDYKCKWYLQNKERINNERSQVTLCGCGVSYTISNKARHFKTQRHLNFEKENMNK